MLIFFSPRSVSNPKKPGCQRYLAGKCWWIGSVVCSQSDGWDEHFVGTSNSGILMAIAVLQDSYHHMEVRNEEVVLRLAPRSQAGVKQSLSLGLSRTFPWVIPPPSWQTAQMPCSGCRVACGSYWTCEWDKSLQYCQTVLLKKRKHYLTVTGTGEKLPIDQIPH